MGVYLHGYQPRSGKEIIDWFKIGEVLQVYQPGPFGPIVRDGREVIEGPADKPPRYYVGVVIKGGVVTHVIDPKNSRKAWTFEAGQLACVDAPPY